MNMTGLGLASWEAYDPSHGLRLCHPAYLEFEDRNVHAYSRPFTSWTDTVRRDKFQEGFPVFKHKAPESLENCMLRFLLKDARRHCASYSVFLPPPHTITSDDAHRPVFPMAFSRCPRVCPGSRCFYARHWLQLGEDWH